MGWKEHINIGWKEHYFFSVDLDVVGEVSKVLAGASNKEVTDKLMV